MKRTTYIMFTLIIGGIVLLASLFAYVKIAGVECDQSWDNPTVIASDVKTYELPLCSELNLNYYYVKENGESYSSYVRNGMHIIITADSIAETPYVIVPVNLAKDVDIDTSDGTLNLGISFADRYYVYNDSVSSPLTICFPPDEAFNKIVYLVDSYTHLAVKSMADDSLTVVVNQPTVLYFNDCVIGDVNINDVSNLKVYSSTFDRLTVRSGDYDSEISYFNGTKVNETLLRGADADFELSGVENFSVLPDSASNIRVTQTYSN